MCGIVNSLRNYFKPTDIYKSQRLIMWVMTTAGYLPLQITEGRRGKRLRASAIGYILSIIFITLNALCWGALAYDERYKTLTYLFERPRLSEIGTNVKLLSIVIMVPLLYASSLRCTKKIVTWMRYIVDIDKRFNLLGIEVNYRSGFYYSICLVGFIVTYLILVVIMSSWQIRVLQDKADILLLDPKKADKLKDAGLVLPLAVVTHHLSLVMAAMFNCYYATIAHEIKERFKCMNRMLKCMVAPVSQLSVDIEVIEATSWNIRNNEQMYNLVDELCGIHNDLCDTCGFVSDYFSVKMVSIVATGFMTITMHGYYFVLSSKESHNEDKKIDLIYTSIESACVSLAIFFACSSASGIVDQNETCTANVHKILNTITDSNTKSKLLEFTLQLMNRKIEFSAFGLFVVQKGMLLAMMEAITTYFLILVEFDERPDNTRQEKYNLEGLETASISRD